MANSDNSLDDDLLTSATDDGSIDTLLKELELERIRMDQNGCKDSADSPMQPNTTDVPLAEEEDLVEENGMLVSPGEGLSPGEGMSNVPSTECVSLSATLQLDVTHEDNVHTNNDDVFYENDQGYNSDPHNFNTSSKFPNGPVLSQKAEINVFGAMKAQRWWESRIPELDRKSEYHSGSDVPSCDDEPEYDFLEFANRYFNLQLADTGAISKTVSIVRRRSLSEFVPMEELIRYTKNSTLPMPLIHLYDAENVNLAICMFKDIWKLMKGEMKGDQINVCLRKMMSQSLERLELRDELYCQLVRQTNDNNNPNSCQRAWCIFALTTVSFKPSQTLLPLLTDS